MGWLALVLGGAGLAAAAAAAFLPALAKAPAAAAGINRADWVNRLFVLAGQADAAGEKAVASASRALIAALVSEKEASKKG